MLSQLTAHISRDQSVLGLPLLAAVLRIDVQTDREMSPALLPFARCWVSLGAARDSLPLWVSRAHRLATQRSAAAIINSGGGAAAIKARSRRHTPDEQHGNEQSRHLPVSNTSIIKLIYSVHRAFEVPMAPP